MGDAALPQIGVQAVAPAGLVWPAGQAVHVVTLGRVLVALNVPASHGVQVWLVDVVPATKIFCPAAHGVKETQAATVPLTVEALNVVAGHAVQTRSAVSVGAVAW